MPESILQLSRTVEELILKALGLEGIDKDNLNIYQNRIDSLRKEMAILAQKFIEQEFIESKLPDAYLALNFPANIIKTEWVVGKLKKIYGDSLPHQALNVLDAGCGEGAGTIGIFNSLKDIKDINFLGVDASTAMINRYRKFTQSLEINAKSSVENIDKSFFKKFQSQYDIIILSNILGEISGNKLNLIKSALTSLHSPGILIIIEPALKFNARSLMEIKSKLKIGNVILPCNHNSPCPLLKKKHEWCYQSIPWVVPQYLELLNRKLFRDLRYLKFSYLIIAKSIETKPKIIPVISPVWEEKGRKRFFICLNGKRIECIRSNKDESDENRVLDSIIKGDHIQLDNFLKRTEESYLVLKETKIKMVC
ncbi:MAG: small ribosomal subunit Rsm22 family protein [candidate division WOR-3 bacterium]